MAGTPAARLYTRGISDAQDMGGDDGRSLHDRGRDGHGGLGEEACALWGFRRSCLSRTLLRTASWGRGHPACKWDGEVPADQCGRDARVLVVMVSDILI